VIQLLNLGADDLNYGLYYACFRGHIEIAKMLIERARCVNKTIDWNYTLHGACRGGHQDIVKLLVQKGADDWNYGFEGACRHNHMELVLAMIDKAQRDGTVINWNSGLYYASLEGHFEIAKLMCDNGADNEFLLYHTELKFEELLYLSNNYKRVDFRKFILNQYPCEYEYYLHDISATIRCVIPNDLEPIIIDFL
jgi:ankyrin repeat protein